jgi:large subunit ribosomal protein L19
MKGVITSPVNMEERAKIGIRAGDTVRVWQKIEERGKTRLQAFEGLVLARKHGNEAGGTFTVRKVASGVGVEKIFPLYSPMIDKIEIVKRAKVRRAKLYYIREKVARDVRRQLRKMKLMALATQSEQEQAEAKKKAEADEAVAEEVPSADGKEETVSKTQEEAPAEEKKETDAPEGESEEKKG